MAQFRIELAQREDDKDIRRILRENPMQGDISLAFQREPSFFDSLAIEGKQNQVVVGRQIETSRVVGFGVRSIKPCFINGQVADLGYLSSLRLDKEFRGSTLIPRGYKFFSELHKDKKTKIYLTTIVEDNLPAKEMLTSGRAGLPTYHDFGTYITYALNLDRLRNEKLEFEIRKASPRDLDSILEFLHKEGRKKQFYPSYEYSDFNDSGLLKGIIPEDIFLAIDSGNIIGTFAQWDQRKFKQSIVESYKGKMKVIKYVYNLFAPLLHKHRLTNEGEQIPFIYAGLIATQNNNPEIFRALLNKAHDDRPDPELSHLMVGLHERDSLNTVMKDFPNIKFKTRLYVVSWKDGENFFKQLDAKVPYLELGSL
jgi:hypothetical protein